jgi:hypothetical protein
MKAIVTVPPYATFLDEVAAHPVVSGLRLNTVMPLKGGPKEALEKLAKLGKPLWVDLKGRQLRVVGAAIPPFTEIRVSHRLKVDCPADAFFADGQEWARIAAVDGQRIILEDGPHRLIGPGESINIIHPSLEIEGTLTETDRAYLVAMKELGLKKVMLSFVEKPSDPAEVRDLLPGAEVVLKIESKRGLELARKHRAKHGQLMAARGDLYVEVVEPHRIVSALRDVIRADPQAIVASRLFPSLARGRVPSATDIGDMAFLASLGYRTFMLGDEVCQRRDSVIAALNLFEAVAGELA